MCDPACRPWIDTSKRSGSCVASAMTDSVCCSTVTIVSGAAVPLMCTGTSTVTFSPRRTISRSMWSNESRTGSRWMAFGRASVSAPSAPSIVKS
jgi:hypothetical protein